ncbi:MAG: Ig-like domain-containing protein [Dysgonamonadaceae bacterium]|nr:Ig-like domain-containing protein [Dysgonamonadaceae bacterium]
MINKNILTIKNKSHLCKKIIGSSFKHVTMLMTVLLSIFLSQCKENEIIDKNEVDYPLVISTDPIDKGVSVTVSKNITASFNLNMDANTINSSSFILMQGSTPILGTITPASGEAKTFTFTPESPLEPFTLYTATIKKGVSNQLKNALQNDYVWSFTTQPQISLSSNPKEGGTTTGGGNFFSDVSIRVKAIPADGYTFSNWTEGTEIVSTDENYSFKIERNRELVANFIKIEPFDNQLPAVIFKGKPFFPIGASGFGGSNYGSEEGFIDPEFIAAGGNIGIIGTLGLPGHEHYEKYRQPNLYKRLETFSRTPAYQDIALMVGFDGALWMDASESNSHGLGGYHKPVIGEELIKRKDILEKDVRKLSQNSNIIGYWFDEPENLISPYYSENRSEFKNGFEEGIARFSAWVYDIIKREHPSAKMMPTLAWQKTYESASALYDINIPNNYSSNEAEKNLYNVNHDAYLAVCAAKKHGGGRSVIFMPAMYDILDNSQPATFNEQRYACFAPITRGVMGIFGWRLGRCSQEYRTNVIFPVMREVADLKDYFLGSWHDELVTSNHDDATVDYLKDLKGYKFMEEDKENKYKMPAVADISYCLRKIDENGKYLLLAVNNQRQRLDVTFQIDLEKLPSDAFDVLNKNNVRFDGKKLTDSFEPFAVHAYIIEP